MSINLHRCCYPENRSSTSPARVSDKSTGLWIGLINLTLTNLIQPN